MENAVEVRPAQSEEESRRLDQLLWDVLWEPLGFPRDIRREFDLVGTPVFDVVALEGAEVVGGLVAGWVGQDRMEIRYLAVRPERQRQGVGAKLISCLAAIAAQQAPATIETHSRYASLGFYEKQGFAPIDDEWLEFAPFAVHGVRFRKVRRRVETQKNP